MKSLRSLKVRYYSLWILFFCFLCPLLINLGNWHPKVAKPTTTITSNGSFIEDKKNILFPSCSIDSTSTNQGTSPDIDQFNIAPGLLVRTLFSSLHDDENNLKIPFFSEVHSQHLSSPVNLYGLFNVYLRSISCNHHSVSFCNALKNFFYVKFFRTLWVTFRSFLSFVHYETLSQAFSQISTSAVFSPSCFASGLIYKFNYTSKAHYYAYKLFEAPSLSTTTSLFPKPSLMFAVKENGFVRIRVDLHPGKYQNNLPLDFPPNAPHSKTLSLEDETQKDASTLPLSSSNSTPKRSKYSFIRLLLGYPFGENTHLYFWEEILLAAVSLLKGSSLETYRKGLENRINLAHFKSMQSSGVITPTMEDFPEEAFARVRTPSAKNFTQDSTRKLQTPQRLSPEKFFSDTFVHSKTSDSVNSPQPLNNTFVFVMTTEQLANLRRSSFLKSLGALKKNNISNSYIPSLKRYPIVNPLTYVEFYVYKFTPLTIVFYNSDNLPLNFSGFVEIVNPGNEALSYEQICLSTTFLFLFGVYIIGAFYIGVATLVYRNKRTLLHVFCLLNIVLCSTIMAANWYNSFLIRKTGLINLYWWFFPHILRKVQEIVLFLIIFLAVFGYTITRRSLSLTETKWLIFLFFLFTSFNVTLLLYPSLETFQFVLLWIITAFGVIAALFTGFSLRSSIREAGLSMDTAVLYSKYRVVSSLIPILLWVLYRGYIYWMFKIAFLPLLFPDENYISYDEWIYVVAENIGDLILYLLVFQLLKPSTPLRIFKDHILLNTENEWNQEEDPS